MELDEAAPPMAQRFSPHLAGTDAASILRAKGFLEAEVCDPMILRAWKLGLCELPQTENYTSEEVNFALDALETSLGENWYALSVD